jgi:hypothetical protein
MMKKQKINLKLLDSYLERIKEGWPAIIYSERQESILRGLEDIVKRIERGIELNQIERRISTKVKHRGGVVRFDGGLARRIRESAGLSRLELAELLHNSLTDEEREAYGSRWAQNIYQFLYRYECWTKPMHFPHSATSRSYIVWLKEHGYNPFDL